MTSANLAISPALRDALSSWLERLRALDGAAANTVAAYGRDVAGFLGFLALHRGGTEGPGAVANLSQTELRAWMAAERGRGLSARSLARALSAVKGFTVWLAEREGVDATTILSARGPKFRRKLPRPLTVDGARDMIDTVWASDDLTLLAAVARHRGFRKAAAECENCLANNVPIAAYEQAIEASHIFNLLQARGVISVQERASYIGRVRDLAVGSAVPILYIY